MTTLTKEQALIISKIIYAVETGGQTYGKQRYDDFTEAGANCSNEKAITIGAGQWYAGEAKQVLELILKKYPNVFRKYDTDGAIEADLKKLSWAKYSISKTSIRAKNIVKIMTTKEGILCQDEMMMNQVTSYAKIVQEKYGTMSVDAIAECINIYHQGGASALKRILTKTKKPYSAKSIKAALDTDIKDKSSKNQVGDYTTRQNKVYSMIETYLVKTISTKETIVKESGDDMSEIKIGHATHDERGKYSGGKAGDQGNNEVFVRHWYNRPWSHIIRFKDKEMAEKVAYAMERACKNDKIGYDQNERNTAFKLARKATPKYDPGKITESCETDCSALVALCCMYAGVPESVLWDGSNSAYTGNIRSKLVSTKKVEVFTDSKYLKSGDYLKRGDILLYEGHHVAVALEDGPKASSSVKKPVTESSSKPSNKAFKVKVTNKLGANIRQGATTEAPLCKSKELKPLKCGDEVTVVGEENGQGNIKWYLIEKDGKRGYISSTLVKKI